MARTIRFGAANDRFVQGSSFQNTELTLSMGRGDDQVFLNRSDDFGGRNTVFAGSGNDVVRSLKEDGSFIQLGAGNDTYIGEGFGSFATERADTVRGGAGNDTFVVTTFKSLYRGDTGNDTFFSFGQQNTFIGGRGNDTISYEPRDDEPGRGGVTVDLASGRVQTGANRQEFLRGIENVVGTASSGTLFGTNGANRITGGAGDDFLTGRGGADTFIWRKADEAAFDAENGDVILDFSRAQRDRIDLSGIDAVAGSRANDAFRFVGGAEFSGRKGELRFGDREDLGDINGDGRGDFVTLLSGDVNGDGVADFGIRLFNIGSLGAADILL